MGNLGPGASAQRISVLKDLAHSIKDAEGRIFEALAQDFGKSPFESFISETGLVLEEISLVCRNLKKWLKPRRVPTPLLLFPARSEIRWEPWGRVLVFAPWNYPFQLALAPLVSAYAAGNSVVLKPSELTPATAQVLKEIVGSVFEPGTVSVVLGGPETASDLLTQSWDHIFFTGSPSVGKIVYQAAAQNLTPVTLELGGKSPAIVLAGADVKTAARRILWGKLFNGGQTCVAPDYLLVHNSLKTAFLDECRRVLAQHHPAGSQASPDYPRIIHGRGWERFHRLLESKQPLLGGQRLKEDLFVEPTFVEVSDPRDPLMNEEIFGPVMPVISFQTESEVLSWVSRNPDPLALYIFGNPSQASGLFDAIPAGGGCINDTVMHFANLHLPFGGRGTSGIGSYHGKKGIETFTHEKALVIQKKSFDLPLRYPPYKKGVLRLLRLFWGRF